jgi:hypothetical protein
MMDEKFVWKLLEIIVRVYASIDDNITKMPNNLNRKTWFEFNSF